jgi:sortilin (neurotensin receptor 3)/BNR/Asp-box repeat protein
VSYDPDPVHRLVLIALAATLLVGCGDDDSGGSTSDPSELAVPWVDPDGDPPIVGGLSVNPGDGTLLMTTNTGMFRITPEAKKPAPFSGTLETPDGTGKLSEALVTRFIEPDTLLGSGHPAAGESLPAALGLIRSEDAGKTWSSVSELGKADFHAIETSGNTIVAALFGAPQVFVSEDSGRTWATKAAPLPIVAMEVDPSDSRRWIASTQSGIFRTTDGGETWREVEPVPNVRFAWTEDSDLYRIDPGGEVKVSTDRGETWKTLGSTGGEPQALTVDSDGKLYAALLDGTVAVSDDGGQTFTEQIAGG